MIVDYPKGADALPSVLWSVDKARARYPGLPLCLYGESAGGHLALLAAAARPSVACVETAGAPTDLERIDATVSSRAATRRAPRRRPTLAAIVAPSDVGRDSGAERRTRARIRVLPDVAVAAAALRPSPSLRQLTFA